MSRKEIETRKLNLEHLMLGQLEYSCAILYKSQKQLMKAQDKILDKLNTQLEDDTISTGRAATTVKQLSDSMYKLHRMGLDLYRTVNGMDDTPLLPPPIDDEIPTAEVTVLPVEDEKEIERMLLKLITGKYDDEDSNNAA